MAFATAFAQGNLSRAFDEAASTDLDDTQMNDASKRSASASPMKEKLDQLKRLRVAAASSEPPPGPDATSTILDAISLLSQQVADIALTTAKKSDLVSLSSDLKQHTKVTVAEAVDPLKSEVHDLSQRVQALEATGQSTAAPSASSSKDLIELQKLVQEFDPSAKRIAFTGFPEMMSATDRLKKINEFVAAKAPNSGYHSGGHFYTGPYSNRKLSAASYVEFSSPDAAREALDAMKDSEFKTNGGTIKIKAARSKLNSKRNFSLRKAEELIKSDAQANGKEVKICWKTSEPGIRSITVDNIEAFRQGKGELGGHFLPPFGGLALP